MPKKRSLKEVASSPLVKKVAAPVPAAGALQKKTAKTPAPRRASRPRPAAPPVSPAPRPVEAAPAAVSQRSIYGSLARMAASILIGFAGGFIFGRFIKVI
jgi:hypothetical protein